MIKGNNGTTCPSTLITTSIGIAVIESIMTDDTEYYVKHALHVGRPGYIVGRETARVLADGIVALLDRVADSNYYDHMGGMVTVDLDSPHYATKAQLRTFAEWIRTSAGFEVT